jgi:uncharacterized protein (DUF58 family)
MKLPKLPTTAERSSASQAGPRAASYIDPTALMRIKSLQLRAKVVVEGFLSGLHRSPYHGFSVEFTEYRQYSPGDDLRYLDWKLYARSDRYYLKRYEDETNLRCYLLVDLSRSMGYSSLAYDKAAYGKTAAATIAYFLSLQRDAVGLVTFDAAIKDYIPARFRPGHLHRLMICLEQSLGGTATDLVSPLEQVAKTAKKRGLVVLLSDLLAPLEAVETRLGYLRSRGHEVVVMRVLDPAEIEFPFREAALFHDVESGRDLYIDPQVARERYRQRFTEHAQAIGRACKKLGIHLVELTTDRPLELALFDFLSTRLAQRRQIARRPALARRVAAGGSA